MARICRESSMGAQGLGGDPCVARHTHATESLQAGHTALNKKIDKKHAQTHTPLHTHTKTEKDTHTRVRAQTHTRMHAHAHKKTHACCTPLTIKRVEKYIKKKPKIYIKVAHVLY